jgi:hypothetical protein
MERLKERKSLAHLADKFNTAPPAGYVAGRGRGVSGFSKPPEDPPKRGASSSAAAQAEPFTQAAKDTDSQGLEGDAADTRELDLTETERYETEGLSMDNAEAGETMEPFNMASERREGHFDDDFNFVWKRKGEDPEDVHDAWLGEIDAASESEEKIEKRKRLLQRQVDVQQEPDEAKLDTTALLRRVANLLQVHETVASALRRMSGAKKHLAAGSKRRADAEVAECDPEEVLRKQQFDELTEAADSLLRAGRFDIYSETRERLYEQLGAVEAPKTCAASGSTPSDAESMRLAATEAGVDLQVHDGAVAGGFALNVATGLYYNAVSGLIFDPKTSLYWAANDASPCYYYWDASHGQFVAAMPPTAQT